jgi:hypothetical protein
MGVEINRSVEKGHRDSILIVSISDAAGQIEREVLRLMGSNRVVSGGLYRQQQAPVFVIFTAAI